MLFVDRARLRARRCEGLRAGQGHGPSQFFEPHKAGADEILVSSLLREIVEPSGVFSFDARKPEVLKGFRKRHRLVRWNDSAD